VLSGYSKEAICSGPVLLKSVPFDKDHRICPFVFSLVPRSPVGFVNLLIEIPLLFLTFLVPEKLTKQAGSSGPGISYPALLILLFPLAFLYHPRLHNALLNFYVTRNMISLKFFDRWDLIDIIVRKVYR
jgi:hypothetical protein